MDYDALHQAFLDYRRAKGRAAAVELITAHGGKNGTLSAVPENRRFALFSAFRDEVPEADEEEAEEMEAAPAPAAASAPKSLADIHAAAYSKWNSAKKRS